MCTLIGRAQQGVRCDRKISSGPHETTSGLAFLSHFVSKVHVSKKHGPPLLSGICLAFSHGERQAVQKKKPSQAAGCSRWIILGTVFGPLVFPGLPAGEGGHWGRAAPPCRAHPTASPRGAHAPACPWSHACASTGGGAQGGAALLEVPVCAQRVQARGGGSKP